MGPTEVAHRSRRMAEIFVPRVFGLRNSVVKPKDGFVTNPTSVNVTDYLQMRTLGHGTSKHTRFQLRSQFGTTRLLESELLRHSEIALGTTYNKVFCSQWLSDNEVIFGTKCNKLVVVNVLTKRLVEIPMLGNNLSRISELESCGVHSICINPSRTLLATSGKNCNEVAVYSLPSLDPVCIGKNAHRDWIFDICWIDDKHFVTGSRDTKVALWRVTIQSEFDSGNLKYSTISPLEMKECKNAKKVRSLVMNSRLREFSALSLNSQLHIWDAEEFTQKWTLNLIGSVENVCLAVNEECNLYAVGSKFRLTLYDPRALSAVERISVKHLGKNIRSVSFNGDIVTIGSGNGLMLFYNCKTSKFLQSPWSMWPLIGLKDESVHPAYLMAPSVWNTFQDGFYHSMYITPAIYTHCYNSEGTALFAAGGPLPADFQGSFAGIWQ